MTAPRRADLQLEVPTLEPDPGMLERLAFVAGAARAAAPARPPVARRLTGLRVAVSTTAVAAISVGGAWATVGVISPDAPERPPVDQPMTPGGTAHPTGPTERPHASEGSTRPGPRANGGRGVGSSQGGSQGKGRSQGQAPGKAQDKAQGKGQGAPDVKPGRGNGRGKGQAKGQRPGRGAAHSQATGHAQAPEQVPNRGPGPSAAGPGDPRRTDPPERRDGPGLGSRKP